MTQSIFLAGHLELLGLFHVDVLVKATIEESGLDIHLVNFQHTIYTVG